LVGLESFHQKNILIETVKKIDSVWARVRKLELEKYTKKKINNKQRHSEIIVEDIDGPANKLIRTIKDLDRGDGVAIEDIPSPSGDVDKVINMLLKEGNIFEVRPGKLKVLE